MGVIQATACMWQSKENLWESGLSFRSMSPEVETPDIRLGCKRLYSWNQFVAPSLTFFSAGPSPLS